jgi:hypothetical protein
MRRIWIVLPLLIVLSSPAYAQDFGVMESAETINQGNFKLRLNPALFFGKEGGDDEFAFSGLIGYGFGPRFDAEVGISLGDGIRIIGGTVEFNVARNDEFTFSVIPGLHVTRGDRALHTTGIDLIFLGSSHVTSRLDVYGALDMAFERSDLFDYQTFHLVPGLEYKINQDLELLAEFGIGLNDDSFHYITGGLAFYFR